VFSHKRHTGKLALSALAATSILCAAAHASDVATPKMVLTAYVNGAGGESVMAGKYDEALAEIKKERAASSEIYTARITNQCVTYAVMKQLPQALSACDEALRAAKYDRLAAQRLASGSSAQNSYVAIAYTNRAVVHMMAKNPEAAKVDMERAQSLAPSAEFVSKNLLAMQASSSKIAQLTVTPTR
jgi:tetratricopeptide (TPR) repeat protein